MKYTHLTQGRDWDGYVKVNGEALAYADVLSYSADGITLADGTVVSEGVEVIFWECRDVAIPKDLREKLWPGGKKYEIAGSL